MVLNHVENNGYTRRCDDMPIIITKVVKEKIPNRKSVFYAYTLFGKVKITGKEYNILNNIIAKCKEE